MENKMKDKLLLTKKNVTLSRSLYIGVSAIMLLSGCTATTNFWESITGERGVDYEGGNRRLPALNPRNVPAPSPNKLPPMVTNVTPQKTEVAMDNPYDQYGANIQQANLSADKSTVHDTSKDDDGNFFTRLFSYDEPAAAPEPVKPLVQEVVPTPAPAPLRKQIIGNPYIPRGAAPVVESQVKNVASESKPQMVNVANKAEIVKTPTSEFAKSVSPNKASSIEPVKITSNDSPVQTTDTKPADETLLGSIGSKLNFFGSDEKKEPSEPYPLISSVPEKPAEFEAVKNSQQQNFNELKSEHGAAQQEKISLDREVSGSSPTNSSSTNILSSNGSSVSANEPPMPPVTIVHSDSGTQPATETKSNSAFDNVMKSLSGKSDNKIDAKIASLPAPTSEENKEENHNNTTSQPYTVPAAFEQSSKEASQPVASTETPGFFDSLFSSSSFSSSGSSASQPAIDKDQTVAPLVSLDAVNISAPTQSSTQSVSTQAADTQQVAAPAAAEALPSTELIKTLPASRYESRRTQTH